MVAVGERMDAGGVNGALDVATGGTFRGPFGCEDSGAGGLCNELVTTAGFRLVGLGDGVLKPDDAVDCRNCW